MGTHGDIILNGSPNVRINGMGAARVMDIFMCPIAGIGVIINGSPNVNINGQPAARVTSLGACSGTTMIMTGSPNTNVS